MADLRDINLLSLGNTIHLVGAVYAGEGKTYLLVLPGERVEAGGLEPLHLDRDGWVEVIRQTDLLETEVLANAADGGVVKAIVRKSTRQIDQDVSWRVWRRDRMACRYCGADDVSLTVDHLVRWEEGGPSTEANLLTACRRCNRTRGALPYGDWLRGPYYRQVSTLLAPEVRAANEAVLGTLDVIPRRLHRRSR